MWICARKNNGALKRLGDRVLAGVEDPDEFEEKNGKEQDMTDLKVDSKFAWLEPFCSLYTCTPDVLAQKHKNAAVQDLPSRRGFDQGLRPGQRKGQRLLRQTQSPPVGARLARESGVSVDINVECDGLFAGKPRSYRNRNTSPQDFDGGFGGAVGP